MHPAPSTQHPAPSTYLRCFSKNAEHALHEVFLVRALGDAVALARIGHVLDRHALPLERGVELERLARRHARIGGAVDDERRRLGAVDVLERRTLPVPSRSSAYITRFQCTVEFSRKMSDVPGHADPVRDAHPWDRRLEPIARERRRPRRRVAAVAAAADADAIRIGQALRDEMVDAVEHVLELLAHQIAVIRLGERDAAADRSAVVRVKRQVAGAGEHLAPSRVRAVPAVGVRRFRAAVRLQRRADSGRRRGSRRASRARPRSPSRLWLSR